MIAKLLKNVMIFEVIDRVIYHLETYESELIRAAIPNWFLAEMTAKHVKMVLTGEGSDELFGGYVYFEDAPTPRAFQDELRRIYGYLGRVNLQRTDRMTMAHSLEARVPFLDREFVNCVMKIDPARKMITKGISNSSSLCLNIISKLMMHES